MYLRLTNGIYPPLRVERTDSGFEFQQPSEYAGFPIDLKILSAGDVIESTGSVELHSELAKTLSETSSGDMPESALQELRELFAPLHGANQRAINLIAQELEFDELRVLTSGTSQWSLRGSTWVELPKKIIVTGQSLRPLYSLDSEWKDHVQTVFNLREEPFIAFEHLHEARRNRSTRFIWVEATIAAELAIKEVLARLEPRLATLLFEVPAPPLRKLYGTILRDVAGERSPYVNQLQEGAEIRNRLVHRPEAVKLDPQKVVDYVALVDSAIWHLVGLCRRAANPRLHRATQWRNRKEIVS